MHLTCFEDRKVDSCVVFSRENKIRQMNDGKESQRVMGKVQPRSSTINRGECTISRLETIVFGHCSNELLPLNHAEGCVTPMLITFTVIAVESCVCVHMVRYNSLDWWGLPSPSNDHQYLTQLYYSLSL